MPHCPPPLRSEGTDSSADLAPVPSFTYRTLLLQATLAASMAPVPSNRWPALPEDDSAHHGMKALNMLLATEHAMGQDYNQPSSRGA